jgi:hypothetical protein
MTPAADPPAAAEYISADPLTPEERERFAGMYDQILRERFGDRPPPTRERLTATQELIQGWRRGWTVVGDTYKQLPASTRPAAASAARARGPGATRTPASLVPLLGIALAVLAFFGWLVVGPTLLSRSHASAPPPIGTRVAGTPQPTEPPPTVGIGGISIGAQSTPTVLTPLTLRLAGRSFVVTPSGLNKDKTWAVSPDPLYANWLAGSLVNLTFFLALEADPGGAAFATALQAPALGPVQVTIASTSGVITTRTFQLDTVRPIGRTDTDVYNSTALGLTVVVRYDQTDTRLYLHGQEVLAGVEATAMPTPTLPIGEATLVPTPTLPIPVAPRGGQD